MEQKGAPPGVPPPSQGQVQRVPNPAGPTPPPTKTKTKTKKKAGPGQIILQRETDKYVEAAGADDLGTGRKLAELVRRLDAGQAVDRFHFFTHKSALMTACCFGNADVVKLLLDRGADLNLRADGGIHSGDMPLHFASQNGRCDVVRVLLDHGANKTLKNAKGKTPLTVRRGGEGGVGRGWGRERVGRERNRERQR